MRYDAGKRIKGRKRHLLVDPLGRVLGVAVTPANTTERDGAHLVLGLVLGWFTWLRILCVDGGPCQLNSPLRKVFIQPREKSGAKSHCPVDI